MRRWDWSLAMGCGSLPVMPYTLYCSGVTLGGLLFLQNLCHAQALYLRWQSLRPFITAPDAAGVGFLPALAYQS